MKRSRISSYLVFVVAVLAFCAKSAEAEKIDAVALVRKAVLAGLPWTHYLGNINRREVMESLQFGLCEPGRTCNGLVVQLYRTPACDWSKTYGFFQLYSTRVAGNSTYDKCVPLSTPEIGYLQTCPNKSYYKVSEFANTDCSGIAYAENTYKVGSCIGTGDTPSYTYWCDSKDSGFIRESMPPKIDSSVSEVPNVYIQCQKNESHHGGYYSGHRASKKQFWGVCDVHHPITASVKANDTKIADCSTIEPQSYYQYFFGTGAANTCYSLENMNAWMTIDHETKRITKNSGYGCSMTGIPVHSETRAFGCSFDAAGSTSVRLTIPGMP